MGMELTQASTGAAGPSGPPADIAALVGRGLADEANSLAAGPGALGATTTGTGNVVFGPNAGAALTEGVDNTLIGLNAGLSLGTDSSWNTAIGEGALDGMVRGFRNVAIGMAALSAPLAISQNSVAIGTDALRDYTGNNSMVAIGGQSQRDATTGNRNTSVGFQSLTNSGASASNTVVGSEAVRNPTGNNNVAIGDLVMGVGTTTLATLENTMVGSQSSLFLTTGDSNIVIGAITTQALSTGSGNIVIGTRAGANMVAGDNNILIGNAALFATDVSDRLNIGGTLFGDLVNKRLGIGMELPLHHFHVQSLSTVAGSQISLETFGTISANLSTVSLRRSRSATINTFSMVASDEVLGQINFYGSSPTTWQIGAQIRAVATGTFSTTSAPTKLQLFTTANASITPFARLTILPQGTLQIFGAASGNVGGFASGIMQIQNTGAAEFDGAFMTGHSSFATNTQLWYFGSVSSSNHDIAMINRKNAKFQIWTNNASRVSVDGAGLTTFNNFTALGSDAPLVKQKRLMTNLGAAASTTILKAHGLTATKILSITGHVTATDNQGYPAQYETFDGLQNFKFAMTFDGTNVILRNDDSSTALIWGQAVEILITYTS